MQSKLSKLWGEAAELCNDATKKSGLVPVLTAAENLGAKRAPKMHHVVVHPEFPWHPDAPQAQQLPGMAAHRARYRELLCEVFRNEKNVIVWQYPGARKHADLPYDDRVVVPTVDRAATGAIQGLIDADAVELQLERMGGIHPKDEFCISGSSMGRCPSQAAVQLFALTQWQVLLPPGAKDTPERRAQKVIQQVMYELKLLVGNTRFNILHNTHLDKEIPEFTLQLGKFATVIPSPEEISPS